MRSQMKHNNGMKTFLSVRVVDGSSSRWSFKVYKFSTLIHLHTDPRVHYIRFLIPYSNKSKDRTNGDVVAAPPAVDLRYSGIG